MFAARGNREQCSGSEKDEHVLLHSQSGLLIEFAFSSGVLHAPVQAIRIYLYTTPKRLGVPSPKATRWCHATP
jgi:hypothetical protein